MSKFFPTIYNKNNEDEPFKDEIINFLDMDGDTAPWEALESRKLSKEQVESMKEALP